MNESTAQVSVLIRCMFDMLDVTRHYSPLTCGHHDADAEVFTQLDGDLRGLEGELPGGHHHHALDHVLGHINLLQQGNAVGSSLSGSILSAGEDVTS